MATEKKQLVTPAPSSFASLVFVYYGDNFLRATFQEQLRLKRAMEGYDHVVLLKHETIPPEFDIGEQDEKAADVIDVPTAANLFK